MRSRSITARQGEISQGASFIWIRGVPVGVAGQCVSPRSAVMATEIHHISAIKGDITGALELLHGALTMVGKALPTVNGLAFPMMRGTTEREA